MREKKKLSIAIFSLVVLIIVGVFVWTNFSSQATNQWFGVGSESGNPAELGNATQESIEPETEDPEPIESETEDTEQTELVTEISELGISELEVETIEVSGTLHEYRSENGEYRQIHIENWGSEPIFVRIRLDEYMEVGPGAGLRSVATDENTEESIPNPQNLAKPLIDGASIDDPGTWKPHAGVNLAAHRCKADFHDYWQWEMGGQKYYFPAPDEYRSNKNFVDSSSPPDLSADSVNEAGIQARQTRLAQVWTMAHWITDGSPIGDFWVIDQDGWAYWAAPLNPGESTGLLLNKVIQTSQPIEDYFYEINVIAQMASIDSGNYMRFGNEVNGGWTSNGRALLEDIVNHTSSDIGIVVHRTLFLTAANTPVVTYTATPSKGEIITEVSYSITEGVYSLEGPQEEFLYLAGVHGTTAIGTLGTGSLGMGRILFFRGFNNTFVFTARDSAGNTANYTFHHRRSDDWLAPTAEFVEPMRPGSGMFFVNNRVVASAYSGVEREQLDSVAESIGGRIIGRRQRRFFIEVGSHTEEELRNICLELMNSGLFYHVILDFLY